LKVHFYGKEGYIVFKTDPSLRKIKRRRVLEPPPVK